MKIESAIYRRGNVEKYIALEMIDKGSYNKIFKNHLYCPRPGCSAMLEYICGNVKTSHFMTWRRKRTGDLANNKGTHVQGCPYSISYTNRETGRERNDSLYKRNVSDRHIHDVLERAYKNLQNGKSQHSTSVGKHKPLGSQPASTSTDQTSSGSAALFGEGEDVPPGVREPKISTRTIDNLDQKDAGKVQCVIGEVSNMYVDSERKFAFINFRQKGTNQVSVRFDENFVSNYPTEFTYFNTVRQYITSTKKLGRVICCCVGVVEPNKSGKFNIRPDRFNAFSINNKKLYELIFDSNVIAVP